MKCRSTCRLTSLTALGASEGGATISTGQEEEGEDKEIISTLQLIADSSRRMTLMIRQISRASRSEVWAHSGDGNARTMDFEACG